MSSPGTYSGVYPPSGGGAGSALTATVPLNITNSVISIPKADGTHNGYLSSADWNTFSTAAGGGISSLSGDVTTTMAVGGVAPATVVRINGVSLAGLATGILKNTTATGVPSIAIASDFPTLNQNTTGSAASFTGTLVGDVGGTQGATLIGAAAVTYAKFQHVAASSLVGNPTGTSAVAQGITLGSSLVFSGTAIDTVQDILTTSNVIFGGVQVNTAFSFATGAQTGYFLQSSNTSGNAQWVALSGVSVASVTGTANQIVASSPTGAVTLSFPSGISLGSYQAIVAPAGGMIASGTVSLGSSAPLTTTQFQITSVLGRGTTTLGTMVGVDAGNHQHIDYAGATFSPTSGSTISSAFEAVPIFAVPTSQTIADAASFHSQPLFTGNLGTITRVYGFWYSGGETSVGTVTNAYGGFFGLPGVGASSKTALYANGAAIGTYTTTSPPSGGLIISGNTSVGSSTAAALFNVGSSNQFQINSTGVVGSGTWQGGVIAGAYGGTGVANTGLTITLASGAVGKYLASDSSGNATWQVLATGTVSSWQGTANQLTPTTATSGAITAALTNGISLGSYQAVTPPVGGAIFPGAISIGNNTPGLNLLLDVSGAVRSQIFSNGSSTYICLPNNGTSQAYGVTAINAGGFFIGRTPGGGGAVNSDIFITTVGCVGINTSAPGANQRFTVTAGTTDISGMVLAGTLNTAATNLYGFNCNPSFSPATTFSAFAQTIQPTFTSPSGGLGQVTGLYIYSSLAGTGAIGTAYGIHIDTGTITGATCSSATGMLINTPTIATSNQNFGLNIVGADVDGALSGCRYQLLINGTTTGDDGGVCAGIIINTTMRPLTTFRNTYGIYALPFAQPHSTNTINNCIGVFAQAQGSAGSGIIAAAYSGYFAQPNAGTAQVALYADSLSIGYTTTTVAAGNALISGLVSIGTGSHASYIQLEISTALGYGLAIVGTQTGDDGANNQYGFVADTTMNPTNTNTWTRAFASIVTHIAPSTKTIPQAVAFYSYNTMSSNIGVITNAYGVWADVGTAGAGTITNSYGVFGALPAHGTNKHAGHFDNLSIGSSYIGASKPPTDGMMCQGQAVFGSTSPVANAAVTINNGNTGNFYLLTYLNTTVSAQDGTNGNWGVYSAITHSLATGCVNVFHHYLQPNISLPSGQTITNVYGLFIGANSQGAGTITNWWGCRIGVGPGGGGGTIGTNIGLQVDVPTNGTTRICAYFAGPIKHGTTATGSTTALLGTGNCPAITGSAPYTWIPTISSDGSTVYFPAWK